MRDPATPDDIAAGIAAARAADMQARANAAADEYLADQAQAQAQTDRSALAKVVADFAADCMPADWLPSFVALPLDSQIAGLLFLARLAGADGLAAALARLQAEAQAAGALP